MTTDPTSFVAGLLLGTALLAALRIAFKHVLVLKLRRDVAALARGDHRPLLKGYADDAALVFTEGQHRWSGTYRGRDEIGTFLADFVRCGLKGEVTDVWMGGWPWSLTILVGFDTTRTMIKDAASMTTTPS